MIVINFITGESMMKNNVLLVMHVIKLRIGNTLKLFCLLSNNIDCHYMSEQYSQDNVLKPRRILLSLYMTFLKN